MQHPEGPTWCKDCGRFDFACEGGECAAPGSGAFDYSTRKGFQNIERCVFYDTPTERCRACGDLAADCDCTGGPQVGDPECTCYEPAYGHQPGCAYYGKVRP